jgi:hypothetical protein
LLLTKFDTKILRQQKVSFDLIFCNYSMFVLLSNYASQIALIIPLTWILGSNSNFLNHPMHLTLIPLFNDTCFVWFVFHCDLIYFDHVSDVLVHEA